LPKPVISDHAESSAMPVRAVEERKPVFLETKNPFDIMSGVNHLETPIENTFTESLPDESPQLNAGGGPITMQALADAAASNRLQKYSPNKSKTPAKRRIRDRKEDADDDVIEPSSRTKRAKPTAKTQEGPVNVRRSLRPRTTKTAEQIRAEAEEEKALEQALEE